MINPRFIFVLALLGCSDSAHDSESVCAQALEQNVAVSHSLARLEKLSQFTIQPECAACPAPRACPDDSAVLARGDEALREMGEIRDAMKRYKNDTNYRYDDLISLLNELTGE